MTCVRWCPILTYFYSKGPHCDNLSVLIATGNAQKGGKWAKITYVNVYTTYKNRTEVRKR